MTYLVLARKYRPRSFDTLIGQDHVVRALTHALDTQRLHHAWLFTGTRGVGKTTLSRILAKSLNCETGITSTPCGVCKACTEIDAGRYIDYVELDAASNRGVDEMTQLLEQAVYAPGAGRFKVYMIDEVHMLTGHAFNAMLKTLEEPPPHVKFILATTDPQKIPVTVLSRCLQFNLKQMPPDSIVQHLAQVLQHESLNCETPALRLIAQAAGGSMRDALSLTDQAIAYSAGEVTEEAVRGMLGTIDQRHLIRLLDALGAGQAGAVLDVAHELSVRGLSYSGALADFSSLLSRVAIAQRVPGALDAADPLTQDVIRLAGVLHPDTVQLFYSIAVHSRQELALAPDEYAGFVMACLRMLALVSDAGPVDMPNLPALDVGGSTAAPAETVAAAAISSTAPTASTASPTPAASTPPTPPTAPAASTAPTRVVGTSTDAAPQSSSSAAPAAEVDQPATAVGAPPAATGTNAKGTDTGGVHTTSAPLESAPVPAVAAPALVDAPPWDVDEVPAADAASATGGSAAAPVAQTSSPAQSVPSSDVQESRVASPGDDRISPPVSRADDAPPDWVNEQIPDEASTFSLDDERDDDDFETLADGFDEDVVGFESGTAPTAAASKAAANPLLRPARPSGRKRLPKIADMTEAGWPALAAELPVTGLAAEVARQSEWLGVSGDTVRLRVAVKTLADSASRIRLQTVLCEHFGQAVRLDVIVGTTGDATAHAVAQSVRAANQAAAEQAVAQDPFVQALLADMGGKVIPNTIRHVESGARP